MACVRSARRSSLESRAIIKTMSVEHAFTPIELAREPQFALAGIRVRPATLEVFGVLDPRVMQVLAPLAQRRRASATA